MLLGIQIPIDQLKDFIENNLKDSSRKNEYLKATEALKNSNDESIIRKAYNSVKNIATEVGKNVLITNLSTQAVNILNKIIARI